MNRRTQPPSSAELGHDQAEQPPSSAELGHDQDDDTVVAIGSDDQAEQPPSSAELGHDYDPVVGFLEMLLTPSRGGVIGLLGGRASLPSYDADMRASLARCERAFKPPLVDQADAVIAAREYRELRARIGDDANSRWKSAPEMRFVQQRMGYLHCDGYDSPLTWARSCVLLGEIITREPR